MGESAQTMKMTKELVSAIDEVDLHSPTLPENRQVQGRGTLVAQAADSPQQSRLGFREMRST